MTVSVVIETFNLGHGTRVLEPLAKLLAMLSPQVVAAEVVVTHTGLPATARAALEVTLGHAIGWVELSRDAGYYTHKNRGFAATTGDVIAFLDGDCAPTPHWLDALIAPIGEEGARVVAGATSYRGPLAPLANQLDFPYFDGAGGRQRSIEDAPHSVRNFFANNVAFARATFAAHPYPTITPMFHGQCQVLGLQLLAHGIAIRFAPQARVIHAWPEGVTEWVTTRLLRGADTVALVPYVVATYAPRATPAVARLGPLPALAVLGARAVTGAWAALRRGPTVRGLGLVACVTIVDALGAAAAPSVYRRLGVA